MPENIPPYIFVAGIDTDAGKTLVSAILMLGLEANYWKPVQAGIAPTTDTLSVQAHTGLPAERFFPETYCLQKPASPHDAAAVEGITIDPDQLQPPASTRPLIIEGAGGLMVPLREDYLFLDWLAAHRIPTVLVVKTYLGSINHSLLSLEALKHRQIPLLGLVFNDGGRPESEGVILQRAGASLLGRVPHLETIDPPTLHNVYQTHFQTLHAKFHHRL